MDTPTHHGLVYRALMRDSNEVLHTCVVSGPSRNVVWLYVHAPAPMVLRLYKDVVGFLRPVLEVLADPASGPGPWSWNLRKGRGRDGYPACVVTGHGRDVWLHVFAQTPTAVRLTPRVVRFLVEALADLPSRDLHDTPALRGTA